MKESNAGTGESVSRERTKYRIAYRARKTPRRMKPRPAVILVTLSSFSPAGNDPASSSAWSFCLLVHQLPSQDANNQIIALQAHISIQFAGKKHPKYKPLKLLCLTGQSQIVCLISSMTYKIPVTAPKISI